MVSSYASGIMGSTNEFDRKTAQANELVNNTYNVFPDCLTLDKEIRKIIFELADETLKRVQRGGGNIHQVGAEQYKTFNTPVTKGRGDEYYIAALTKKKGQMESLFAANFCRDKIETLRLNESANILTKSAIVNEKDILVKNKNEQNIYIGLGVVVLLVGLYIVIKE